MTPDVLLEVMSDFDHHKRMLYNTPNTIQKYSAEDYQGAFKMGAMGRWKLTNHLHQDVDYSNSDIEYVYNELGLRGPKPDIDNPNRILFAGPCTFFGDGVNVEDSFVHKFASIYDASYVNISEARFFVKMLDDIERIAEWYKPTMIVMGSTRFFDEFSLMESHMRIRLKRSYYADEETTGLIRNEMRGQMKRRNLETLKYIFEYMSNKYKVPIYFLHEKDFNKFEGEEYHGVNTMEILREWMVDLGRDCKHPGPKSHEIITNELYKRQRIQKV